MISQTDLHWSCESYLEDSGVLIDQCIFDIFRHKPGRCHLFSGRDMPNGSDTSNPRLKTTQPNCLGSFPVVACEVKESPFEPKPAVDRGGGWATRGGHGG